MQCEQTPWQKWYAEGNIKFFKEPTEEQLITAYYSNVYKIGVTEVKKIPFDGAVCEACGVCPQAYHFEAKVYEKDEAKLQAEGWREMNTNGADNDEIEISYGKGTSWDTWTETITFYSDGNIVLESGKERKEGKIPKEELLKFAHEIVDYGFFGWKNIYQCEAGCPAETQTEKLAVKINESEKTILIKPPIEVPENLPKIIEKINGFENNLNSAKVMECTKNSDCTVTGCSGQVCAKEEAITTCEYLPQYDCYKLTSCECIEGKCAWKETPKFQKCLQEKS